ncbi:hypothetical protein PT2222_420048 [Paraburkholderia tropica]
MIRIDVDHKGAQRVLEMTCNFMLQDVELTLTQMDSNVIVRMETVTCSAQSLTNDLR